MICLIAERLQAQISSFLPGNRSFTPNAAAKPDLVQRPQLAIHFAEVLPKDIGHMGKGSFILRLDQLDSSYLVLVSLALLALIAGIFFQIGLIGRLVDAIGRIIRASVRNGFRVWERLFAWASWPLFLAIVVAWLGVGWLAARQLPGLTVVCALAPLLMGLTACLAYMFIDL